MAGQQLVKPFALSNANAEHHREHGTGPASVPGSLSCVTNPHPEEGCTQLSPHELICYITTRASGVGLQRTCTWGLTPGNASMPLVLDGFSM